MSKASRNDLVLSVNTGSSSLKISLYKVLSPSEYKTSPASPEPVELLLTSSISNISSPPAKFSFKNLRGESTGSVKGQSIDSIKDHSSAFAHFVEHLSKEADIDRNRIAHICHRVVHGGDYHDPVVISNKTYHHIEKLSDLAPSHNGSALSVIKSCISDLPNANSIAFFDTTFHHSIPSHITSYAIDQSVAKKRGLKKYGFHGLSYSFILRAVSKFYERPADTLNLIVLHLGSGASVCAIRNGQSMDTSMGLTPLNGLTLAQESSLASAETSGTNVSAKRPSASRNETSESALSILAANDMQFHIYLASVEAADGTENVPSFLHVPSGVIQEVLDWMNFLESHQICCSYNILPIFKTIEDEGSQYLDKIFDTFPEKEKKEVAELTEAFTQCWWFCVRKHADRQLAHRAAVSKVFAMHSDYDLTLTDHVKAFIFHICCESLSTYHWVELPTLPSPLDSEKVSRFSNVFCHLTHTWMSPDDLRAQVEPAGDYPLRRDEIMDLACKQPGLLPQEASFRHPLDNVVGYIWRGCGLPVQQFMERLIRPVNSSKDLGLSKYSRADQYVIISLPIGPVLTQEQLVYIMTFLDWTTLMGPLCGLNLDIPALVQEFHVAQFGVAKNKVCVGLLSGSAIYACLNIPYPLYGLATSMHKSALFVARAQFKDDGGLQFAIQKVHQWGTLADPVQYFSYVSTLDAHVQWFKDHVWKHIQDSQNESSALDWVLENLKNRDLKKPWMKPADPVEVDHVKADHEQNEIALTDGSDNSLANNRIVDWIDKTSRQTSHHVVPDDSPSHNDNTFLGPAH
ncbi:hypothetical protein D9758_003952 [Tetrapyrgos nigripes]|uniref:Acetate kinase n=1 Tax=Tetrapyrgos nigripes TaxID=182062 RepID=A0A8H5LRV9_9AGAR|nr:hypothetical protein D9758_003952 [Tetrapyrgos nigripes]